MRNQYSFRVIANVNGFIEYLTPPSMQKTGGKPELYKTCYNAPYSQIVWLR